MMTWGFTAFIIGAVVLAGFWELRRSWREAGEKLHAHIHAPRPAGECADVLDDLALIDGTGGDLDHQAAHAAWMFRDDEHLSLTWGDPADVDLIDDYIAIWAAQQEGR